MPFMALELLSSVGLSQTPVLHDYHDVEAVCWVVFWLIVQSKDGSTERYSFAGWEKADATTCHEEKSALFGHLHLHPFTEPNELLQEPIRALLNKFGKHYFQKLFGEQVPVSDVGGWVDGCDKKIRA